jgi:hypothetical protein
MQLTEELLNEKKIKAKQKLVVIQDKLVKALKRGDACEKFLQEFKALAVWEILLSEYLFSQDPQCIVSENCLSEEQILNICSKIDKL